MRADDAPELVRGVRPAARAAAVAGHPRRARATRTTRALVEGFIAGPRVRARRADEPRRAARAGDLRQARSARRPVLRGNDLRHAVVGAGRRAAGAIVEAVDAGGRGARPAPRPDPRRVPRQRRRRVRARGRGAADWRPVRARAALRDTRRELAAIQSPIRSRSRSCCCATRSANRPTTGAREPAPRA